MRILKILSVLLAAAILITGCGVRKEPVEEGAVTLKWVVAAPGSKQKDSDKVWAEFNEKLAEHLPGVKVNIEMIAFDDYAEKWKLMAASGEKVDIAWHGWMMDYVSEVNQGAYSGLNNLLDEYGQDLKAELPDWIFEKAMIDGEVYSIPIYQMATDMRIGIYTQKERAEKYLDADKMRDTFYASPYLTQAGLDQLADYYKALKENDELYLGMGGMGFLNFLGFENILSYQLFVDKSTTDFKVYPFYEVPGYMLNLDARRSWFDEGYIRRDVLSVENPPNANSLVNGFATWIQHYFVGEEEKVSNNKENVDISIIPIEKEHYISAGASTSALVIPKNAAHPKEAMQVIDLLNTEKGKELYNLLVYGLEGTHYTKIDDNTIETIGYIGNDTARANYGITKFTIGNTFHGYATQADIEGWNDYIKDDVHANAVVSPVMGFKVNLENIANEFAQCEAIFWEYYEPLNSGALENYKSVYEEFTEKLNRAGFQKIVDDVQEQLTKWAQDNDKL